ncbi:Hypothetical predicted protein [Marmota monax]|uniref:alpha-1,6-mannosyl-glycoprotein 6-beta-N-acetylglucosaminyltransferase n=1 Tax=Marmota monax TaxID=9995 RepID=A0A5E4AJ65_MARMO|nr:hypothetical protein GHT09_017827 [Marmota monax]VTJ56522.1 Hypothetical predicted protein [Marmota monax]
MGVLALPPLGTLVARTDGQVSALPCCVSREGHTSWAPSWETWGPWGCARKGSLQGPGLVTPPAQTWPPPQWMRARWTSDPCYAFFGVDGTECSFLIYLSEVEWFCPPLPWRNQTSAQTAPKPLPRVQVGLEVGDVSQAGQSRGSGRDLSPARVESGCVRRWTDGRSVRQCPS